MQKDIKLPAALMLAQTVKKKVYLLLKRQTLVQKLDYSHKLRETC